MKMIRHKRKSKNRTCQSSKISNSRVKPRIMKGGIKMNAIELAESNVQLTCLTEISKIFQAVIKKNDWTPEEYEKSFGLVRHKNVKRKN